MPLQRLLNLCYVLLTENQTKEGRAKVDAQLREPPPMRVLRPASGQAAQDRSGFLAAMQSARG